ncbi:hypothetical protein J610_4052 [Acinetobacter sp. 723929]|nr:hypothetical protein J610_4052 [Acinetobacter sp. 723929]
MTIEKSGKNEKRMFFDQFYWLKVTDLLNKKPTCFQVGFLSFASQFFIA